eukprot:3370911-Prymnesium_polylepis.1
MEAQHTQQARHGGTAQAQGNRAACSAAASPTCVLREYLRRLSLAESARLESGRADGIQQRLRVLQPHALLRGGDGQVLRLLQHLRGSRGGGGGSRLVVAWWDSPQNKRWDLRYV